MLPMTAAPSAACIADVALVATTGPCGLGGLAAYERNLVIRLADLSHPTCSARFRSEWQRALDYSAREAPGTDLFRGVPVTTIAPRRSAVPLLRLANRLVDRRWAQDAVTATAVAAWQGALAASIPPGARIIHAVGCGRELIGFAAMAEARRRRIPFSLWPAVHIDSWGDSAIDLALYRGADGIFVQSPAEHRHLEQLGIRRNRMHLCGLGPDVPLDGDARAFRSRAGIGERPVVLFVGRKSRTKGYHQLREATAALRRRVPDALLVVIGQDYDPPYPDLPPEGVLDLGEADQATKAGALAACDVLCVPSSSEAFGIVYVEAWAYAKPVVALDTPASRALIAPEETGLLVSDRGRALVEALARVLADDRLRAALGAAGQREYARRYTWEATVATHLRVFAELAA
jgi:glycosyltransferase involved in cell wall biosynthesis